MSLKSVMSGLSSKMERLTTATGMNNSSLRDLNSTVGSLVNQLKTSMQMDQRLTLANETLRGFMGKNSAVIEGNTAGIERSTQQFRVRVEVTAGKAHIEIQDGTELHVVP